MRVPNFEEVIRFHGHSCPGLAFGYRVAGAAMPRLLADRAVDEDLVAVVENNSCADKVMAARMVGAGTTAMCIPCAARREF